MKVSFCTTCMGRLCHLRETLPKNLADNQDAEFVVLDYNSGDGLEEWMREFMRGYVDSGRVKYYSERTAKFFNPRHAKNVAHLLSSGDALVNLDADNFTGPGYSTKVAEVLSTSDTFLRADQTGRAKSQTGIAGRIAFRTEDFRRLRGYDETCHGYGGDDPDISHRAQQMGLQKVLVRWPGEDVIQHTNEERTKRFASGVPCDVSGWKNKEVWNNRPPGAIVNPNGYGVATVYDGFSDRKVEVGVGPA